MTVDIPHMIANVAVILVVIWAFKRLGLLTGASKGVRFGATVVVIVATLFLMNLVWPFGDVV